MRISRAALHFWEEPCISGKGGSGAVFFTGCNLKCIFCQNAAISENGIGREVSAEELCDIFFDLKDQGAHNINLVTPSHFVPEIRKAILLAKEKGFALPFVYNSSAYEKPETLKLLDGLIDIYLPDFKYMDGKIAADYSHAPDYPEVAKAAIAEMIRQVGDPEFEESEEDSPALMKKGVIVRHLLLPLGVNNAFSVIDYLHRTYGDRIYLSVMNQYTPLYDVPGALSAEQKKRLAPYPALHRKVTKREYQKVIQFCLDLNMSQVFIQEGDVASESFIPPFPKNDQ
jgi:putative pyruvate formate lyase activating enzyme